MKKILFGLLTGLCFLTGCNHKPELPPQNSFLVVYPNPASNMATVGVRNLNSQEYLLQVFDAKGKLLLEKTDQQNQHFSIRLEGQPKGKYQVILKTKNAVFNQTLLKL